MRYLSASVEVEDHLEAREERVELLDCALGTLASRRHDAHEAGDVRLCRVLAQDYNGDRTGLYIPGWRETARGKDLPCRTEVCTWL